MVLTVPFVFLINMAYHNDTGEHINILNIYLFLCFVAIILSDIVDGHIARKMSLTSSAGAKLDLVADFFYVLGTTSILSFLNLLPIWFPVVPVISFSVFIFTSKKISAVEHKKSQLQASKSVRFYKKGRFIIVHNIAFDSIGKTAAILTMLIPGLFVFRNLLVDVTAIMHVSSYIITGLFCVAIFYRLQNSHE